MYSRQSQNCALIWSRVHWKHKDAFELPLLTLYYCLVKLWLVRNIKMRFCLQLLRWETSIAAVNLYLTRKIYLWSETSGRHFLNSIKAKILQIFKILDVKYFFEINKPDENDYCTSFSLYVEIMFSAGFNSLYVINIYLSDLKNSITKTVWVPIETICNKKMKLTGHLWFKIHSWQLHFYHNVMKIESQNKTKL